jgi:hypothetical protein
MGLLDDAIREHLELKRRRGADPDEVTRQENEALGAGRRAEFARPEGGDAPAETGEAAVPAEPAAEAPAAPFDADADAPVPEFDPAPAAPRHDPFAPAERAAPEPEPPAAPPEPPPPEPVVEAEGPVEAGDEREPFDAEPPQAPAEPPTERHDWLEDEPDEVPADEALDHPRPAEGEEGEDVLEETPEFLQETPEHDRLWFEQRPPRDFDWDK